MPDNYVSPKKSLPQISLWLNSAVDVCAEYEQCMNKARRKAYGLKVIVTNILIDLGDRCGTCDNLGSDYCNTCKVATMLDDMKEIKEASNAIFKGGANEG